MLTLQGVAYAHPDKDVLFEDLHLTINDHEKAALIGNNGTGKSTLLNILSGSLIPSKGIVKTSSGPYYVPQLFDRFEHCSIANALGIDKKLQALRSIMSGNVSDENLALLDDDWDIEERCEKAFSHWGLDKTGLFQRIQELSGGEKTKVFLAGINILRPGIILFDEPSNHLDKEGRHKLYDLIATTKCTSVIVSHDRQLLELLPTVLELGKNGITTYGGNYIFYTKQKAIAMGAFDQQLKDKEKELRKARTTEQKATERRQKLDERGKQKQEKAGLPAISMNTFRNNAEKATARLKNTHSEKANIISTELGNLRKEITANDKMRMALHDSSLHKGKILVDANNINFGYGGQMLWCKPLTFEIVSGCRLALSGPNGSGKTTLVRMLLGDKQPQTGTLKRADIKTVYVDQDYSLINGTLTIRQQAQWYNTMGFEDHEVNIRLDRFLFTKDSWNKPCNALSGGERMRLALCCLAIGSKAPDLIVLDEPTNNLDIQNIEILTAAINAYKGTLIVVSHDETFLEQVGISQIIQVAEGGF